MGRNRSNPIDRFWSKVDKQSNEDCWDWKAGLRGAYGEFWIDGRNVGAHVFSYLISHKDMSCIDSGIFVCHICDNPKCVNPSHLFLGTPRDNTLDMINKGRVNRLRSSHNYVSGEMHHSSRLTHEQSEEIKRTYKKGVRGCGLRILAKKYGVSPNAIYYVVNKPERSV